MKISGTESESRPSRDKVLMETAWVFSHRSTCTRLGVGAVTSRDGRVLSTGYNGAPAGMKHCVHTEWSVLEDDPIPRWVQDRCELENLDPADWLWLDNNGDQVKVGLKDSIMASQPQLSGCTRAVHAEANTVAFAARHGVSLEGAELHVTHMPCLNCAMLIVNAGITRVMYDQPYRITDGVKLLSEAGIPVQHV